jgi:hypothetical protein
MDCDSCHWVGEIKRDSIDMPQILAQIWLDLYRDKKDIGPVLSET